MINLISNYFILVLCTYMIASISLFKYVYTRTCILLNVSTMVVRLSGLITYFIYIYTHKRYTFLLHFICVLIFYYLLPSKCYAFVFIFFIRLISYINTQ